jgi:hypothetical protein
LLHPQLTILLIESHKKARFGAKLSEKGGAKGTQRVPSQDEIGS